MKAELLRSRRNFERQRGGRETRDEVPGRGEGLGVCKGEIISLKKLSPLSPRLHPIQKPLTS